MSTKIAQLQKAVSMLTEKVKQLESEESVAVQQLSVSAEKKLNLQGNILIGLLRMLKESFPVEEKMVEGSTCLWENIFLFKGQLYVVEESDSKK